MSSSHRVGHRNTRVEVTMTGKDVACTSRCFTPARQETGDPSVQYEVWHNQLHCMQLVVICQDAADLDLARSLSGPSFGRDRLKLAYNRLSHAPLHLRMSGRTKKLRSRTVQGGLAHRVQLGQHSC